eukprot:Gb_02321 [translate_table: standard]
MATNGHLGAAAFLILIIMAFLQPALSYMEMESPLPLINSNSRRTFTRAPTKLVMATFALYPVVAILWVLFAYFCVKTLAAGDYNVDDNIICRLRIRACSHWNKTCRSGLPNLRPKSISEWEKTNE